MDIFYKIVLNFIYCIETVMQRRIKNIFYFSFPDPISSIQAVTTRTTTSPGSTWLSQMDIPEMNSLIQSTMHTWKTTICTEARKYYIFLINLGEAKNGVKYSRW